MGASGAERSGFSRNEGGASKGAAVRVAVGASEGARSSAELWERSDRAFVGMVGTSLIRGIDGWFVPASVAGSVPIEIRMAYEEGCTFPFADVRNIGARVCHHDAKTVTSRLQLPIGKAGLELFGHRDGL